MAVATSAGVGGSERGVGDLVGVSQRAKSLDEVVLEGGLCNTLVPQKAQDVTKQPSHMLEYQNLAAYNPTNRVKRRNNNKINIYIYITFN